MSSQLKHFITPHEYLDMERASPDVKHEYVNGEIYLMSGASRQHNLINNNLSAELNQLLRESPCEVYSNDMKVRVAERKYFYPDTVVVCAEPQFHDEQTDVLLNPLVVIEVLSPSTEGYDRGLKFDFYRRIASLKTYVLVSQSEINLHVFEKDDDEVWRFRGYAENDDWLEIESLKFRLSIAEIYRKVICKAAAHGSEKTFDE